MSSETVIIRQPAEVTRLFKFTDGRKVIIMETDDNIFEDSLDLMISSASSLKLSDYIIEIHAASRKYCVMLDQGRYCSFPFITKRDMPYITRLHARRQLKCIYYNDVKVDASDLLSVEYPIPKLELSASSGYHNSMIDLINISSEVRVVCDIPPSDSVYRAMDDLFSQVTSPHIKKIGYPLRIVDFESTLIRCPSLWNLCVRLTEAPTVPVAKRRKTSNENLHIPNFTEQMSTVRENCNGYHIRAFYREVRDRTTLSRKFHFLIDIEQFELPHLNGYRLRKHPIYQPDW